MVMSDWFAYIIVGAALLMALAQFIGWKSGYESGYEKGQKDGYKNGWIRGIDAERRAHEEETEISNTQESQQHVI